MAEKQFKSCIQHRRDTSSKWTTENPILRNGELILVDTADGQLRFKVGDGNKTYTQLPFTDETLRSLISESGGKDYRVIEEAAGYYVLQSASAGTENWENVLVDGEEMVWNLKRFIGTLPSNKSTIMAYIGSTTDSSDDTVFGYINNLAGSSGTLTTLPISNITAGTNSADITMSNLDHSGGAVGGLGVEADGLVSYISEIRQKSWYAETSFRAGVSYRTVDIYGTTLDYPVAVIRNWGSSSAWYNYGWSVGGKYDVVVSGLPTSNCEVFLIARQPTADDSVTSSSDTSKGIQCYAHYDSTSSGTIDFSSVLLEMGYDAMPANAYVVVNCSTQSSPLMTATGAEFAEAIRLSSEGELSIRTSDDDYVVAGINGPGIKVGSDDGQWIHYNSDGICYDDGDYVRKVLFDANTSYLIGDWEVGSLASSTPVTSDATKKNTIEDQPEVYSRIFDRLRPVIFKYNNGTSNRFHTGLIAQEVEAAVLAEGITTQSFAPVVYTEDDSGNKNNYGIRYEELVSMCIYEIQQLKQRVSVLEKALEEQSNG